VEICEDMKSPFDLLIKASETIIYFCIYVEKNLESIV